MRGAWDEVYDREGDLTLLKKVEEKPLFMHFYPLEKANADVSKIKEVIDKFVVSSDVKMEGSVEGK